MILAVDTSLGTAVALVDGDGVVRAEAATADALGHAEVIGDLLYDVAAKAEITHVVTGMGPGPFTGLRIGIAAARTFALGRGVPVIPVPSHYAPALAALSPHRVSILPPSEYAPDAASILTGQQDTHSTHEPFAIVTDARRREVAVSIFEGTDADGIPNLTADTVLVPRANVEEHLAGIRMVEVSQLAASDLALVATRALAVGRTLTGPEPLYLRAPDVTMPGAPKRVGT